MLYLENDNGNINDDRIRMTRPRPTCLTPLIHSFFCCFCVVVFLLDRLDSVLGSVRQWRIIIQYMLILCHYKLKLKLQDRSSYHN